MMEPQYGMNTVMEKNWAGAAVSKDNVEAYFEMLMPSTKAVRADGNRDIFVHDRDVLELSDYKWDLKSWDGVLLATQYFRVSSSGKARKKRGSCMGRYSLYQHAIINKDAGLEDVPVYKQDGGDNYLYLANGYWCVGPVIGYFGRCNLYQPKNGESPPSPTPSKSLPWQYGVRGEWKDDPTLKVYPCYLK